MKSHSRLHSSIARCMYARLSSTSLSNSASVIGPPPSRLCVDRMLDPLGLVLDDPGRLRHLEPLQHLADDAHALLEVVHVDADVAHAQVDGRAAAGDLALVAQGLLQLVLDGVPVGGVHARPKQDRQRTWFRHLCCPPPLTSFSNPRTAAARVNLCCPPTWC